MKINFKNKNTRIFFIVSSFASFIILFLLYTFLVLVFSYEPNENTAKAGDDRYFFKDIIDDDPYLTRNPGLEDMLSGPIISDADPFLGRVDADKAIVIFADFTCPFCHNMEMMLKEIAGSNPDIRLVRKDYPENNENGFSFRAALAGRCAYAQDKFWEYHNELLDLDLDESVRDAVIIKNTLTEAAKSANLNLKTFEECYDNDLTKNFILDNIEEAAALGIPAVPFVYVNDKTIMGGINKEDLLEIINRKEI